MYVCVCVCVCVRGRVHVRFDVHLSVTGRCLWGCLWVFVGSWCAVSSACAHAHAHTMAGVHVLGA